MLETEKTRLLVDAGLGKRETLARLAAVGKDVEHIDGILITHEHADHCSGLPQMLGMWKAPLYVTEATLAELHRGLEERRELIRSGAFEKMMAAAAAAHAAAES